MEMVGVDSSICSDLAWLKVWQLFGGDCIRQMNCVNCHNDDDGGGVVINNL